MKAAFPVLLVFTLAAFVQAGPVIRNDLRGLDAIARDHTAQVLEGKGILLPGPEPYAEDRGIVLFGLPDDDWPALFRLGLAGVWDHGFLVYPFSVRTDDETGERMFFNSAGSVIGSVSPVSAAWPSSGFRAWFGLAAFGAIPAERELSHYVSRYVLVHESDAEAYRAALHEISVATKVSRAPSRRNTSARDLDHLRITDFSVVSNGCLLTAAWPASLSVSGGLDLWASTSLTTRTWNRASAYVVSSSPQSRTLFLPTNAIPGFIDLEHWHLHGETCTATTNVVASPLDPGVLLTNVVYACSHRMPQQAAFFRIARRTDQDGDGVDDAAEILQYGSSPESWDSDGDGLPDFWEIAMGLDPSRTDGANGANGDPDGDQVPNWEEFVYMTDPWLADSDRGGKSDREEIDTGLNPNDSDDDDSPGGDVVSVMISFGDGSGTHSEIWQLDVDAAERSLPIRCLISPTGRAVAFPVKFARGRAYRLSLAHLHSIREHPDYDWSLQVDGWPKTLTGMVPESEARFVTLADKRILLVNPDGLMGELNEPSGTVNRAVSDGTYIDVFDLDIEKSRYRAQVGTNATFRVSLTNPDTPAIWRIESGPARLSTTEGSYARSTCITNTGGIWVAPGNVLQTSVLTAVYPNTTGVVETASIVPIRIELSPITRQTDPGSGRLYNPAAVAATSNGLFKIIVDAPSDAPVPDSEIVWRAKDCSSSDLWFENGGHGRVAVAHVSTDEAIRTAEIAITDFVGPNPEIKLQAYADFRTVPVRFVIARSDLGDYPGEMSQSELHAQLRNWLSVSCREYEQVAVRFVDAGPHCEILDTETLLCLQDDYTRLQNAFSEIQDSNCVKVLVLSSLYEGEEPIYGGFTYIGIREGHRILFGVAIPGLSPASVFSHEMGHCCGLTDIYSGAELLLQNIDTDCHSVAEMKFQSPMVPKDGTGTHLFYDSGLRVSSIVSRVLMHGEQDANDTGFYDIPLGKLYGVGLGADQTFSNGMVSVGNENLDTSWRSQ